MNKRFFLLTVIGLMMTAMAWGQAPTKGSNMWNVNFSYDFALKSGYSGVIAFQPEFGHYFTDQCYVGLGTGVLTDDKVNSWSIPLFLRAEFDFPSKDLIPYFSVQGGYDFSLSDTEYSSGCFRINPSIGVKLPLSSTTMLNLGFGYTRTIYNGSGIDYLGLKAGFAFGTQGRGLSKYLKKVSYGVELETYSKVKSEESESDNQTQYSSIYGVRFSMLFPITKQFGLGPSVGVGMLKDFYSYRGDTDSTNEVYGSFAVRAKYNVTQVAINDKIYPFVQVDFGCAPAYCETLEPRIYPAVGVSYKVGKKSSADISVGYSEIPVDRDDGITEGKGSLRLAIGYSF
jgi:hypothetical protein